MSVEFKTGDLFKEHYDAIVNTVNCVGVMGKGIALQFKKKYKKNYASYKKACNKGLVIPGKMFTSPTKDMFHNEPLIINFPTKQHWRSKSKLEFIENGLDNLAEVIQKENIKTIALPALGCGNGELNWTDVKPIIKSKLEILKNTKVVVFEPNNNEKPEHYGKDSSWTYPRVILINLFSELQEYFGGHLSHLVMQKLVYFLQESGVDYKANFDKYEYGPYSPNLKENFKKLNNQEYFSGFEKELNAFTEERVAIVSSHKVAEANDRLKTYKEKDIEKVIKKISQLVDGFESPWGMELLATVHHCAKETKSSNYLSICQCIRDWGEFKSNKYDEHQIKIALNRLVEDKFI